MSATMLDFVHMYGIQVQPAKRDEVPLPLAEDALEMLQMPEPYYAGG